MEIIRAGRLIFLAGLEIESKWKKGTDKREIILVRIARRFFFFFFLIKLKVVFFRKKNLKSILYKEEGRESKEGTSLEAKLSFL